jgi:hypothetical protein
MVNFLPREHTPVGLLLERPANSWLLSSLWIFFDKHSLESGNSEVIPPLYPTKITDIWTIKHKNSIILHVIF